MPELPEVETVRQTLKNLVLKKTIDDVSVYWGNIIKNPRDPDEFKRLLKGQSFLDIERKGKFMIFHMDDLVLVSHLRMEGKFGLYDAEVEKPKHTHVVFHFTDGTELRYDDVRKFGTMHVFPKGEELDRKPLNQLGPDPFDKAFTLDYFFHKLQRTSRNIKAVLLDQSIVAGLGNIYVDEALYRARIHPERLANKLLKEEADRIRKSSVQIIEEAIGLGGSTIRSYLNSQGKIGSFQQNLKVYGKQDTSCQECGDVIIKTKVSGRGTHICPTCQSYQNF
ncbi:DNA-formamidopyrimidine glycosylase [Halobacillus halophilus]|uniref:Formamidopyrimidine-DNA glycosylase n=1 Tax=Halobacillus halophilus (strain ATCC 35676 / DSM 2266 / JCM 20832 / KCTC 3685 / LMG 17431 / NBRC 102448 / NCIMB 2269) TaxID=866895 RepID=I0JPM7_HALH3|nr:DNA-formamidopyrimidine glycosylase [Halobacillus halophilus]ASF40128.1 DNA-formamidopyrimidine glycosylase [Halobacillus halophilus]CCG46097.1 formamidopyrimidine-DNA glycosylase [Halobacillus halophilus DSM 2266]